MSVTSQGSDENQTPGGSSPPAEAEDLSSLYKYPSLGRLYDEPDGRALAQMRARLKGTHQELERIIRRGTKEDAERAMRASRACAATLDLLDELEQMRERANR
jgi:hypothetical protein